MSSTQPAVVLPFGATFKPLLAESTLSDKDLIQTLQKRGVFAGPSKRNKKDIISILSSTLLSPREFSLMSEKQKKKDSKTNNSSIQAAWVNDRMSLITAMPDDLDEFINKVLDENDSFVIEGKQCNILNADKFEIDLVIKRLDWKKDALTNMNFHSCNITVERNGNSLLINSERSVLDTKSIVESLRKSIVEHLTKNGSIDSGKGISQVMVDSFVSNEYVFLYLISFLEQPFQHLTFERMLNVTAGISSENPLPDKLDWLQKDVSEFSMYGDDVKNTDLIKAGTSGALVFGEIEAEFSFSYANASGKCSIRYGFPRHFSGKKKQKNVEFEAKITKIKVQNNFEHDLEINKTSRTILIEFQKHKYDVLTDKSYLKASTDNLNKLVEKSQLDLFPI